MKHIFPFLAALLLSLHAASLEIIRDGKATYGVLAAGEQPSIVSVRFKMSEVDAMAAKLTFGTKQ